MLNTSFKRTILLCSGILLLLFYFASVIAVWINADFNSASPDPVYYVFSSLLVIASFAVVCLYTRQFSYSDNKICWILTFLLVIAFSVFDVFTRDLYSFFPYNTLDVFIAVRRFFALCIMGMLFLDRHSGFFYGMQGFSVHIFIVVSLSLCLVSVLPATPDFNLHYFLIMLLLLIGIVFRTFVINLKSANLKVYFNFINTLSDLMLEIGVFLFIVSSETIVVAIAFLFVFLAFIILSLEWIKIIDRDF